MTELDADKFFVRGIPGGVILQIRVQPRASSVSVGPVQKGRLRIRLTSPPVENAANKQCIQVLAEALNIRPHNISVFAGHRGQNKQIRVDGVESQSVIKSLGL